MNIIMTFVTSRRDVGFTVCSYQCPIIKLGSALIRIAIPFFFCLRHVENESIFHQNF